MLGIRPQYEALRIGGIYLLVKVTDVAALKHGSIRSIGSEEGGTRQGDAQNLAGSSGVESSAAESGGVILLVDDEDSVRLVTARVLERHGYQVIPAGTGGAALAAIDVHPERIDLAMVDIGLPDIDGVVLVGQILERRSEISILYTSGHSDERVVGELARDRTSGFLEKPFSVQDLLGAVHAGMQKREPSQEASS
jgi:CheY-like chemotaxis protein